MGKVDFIALPLTDMAYSVGPPKALLGLGLAKLSFLRDLSIYSAPDINMLLGANFSVDSSMAELSSLSFTRNSFSGRPNLLDLPALKKICIITTRCLPKWLEGQDFHTLSMCSSRQLSKIDVCKLRCWR